MTPSNRLLYQSKTRQWVFQSEPHVRMLLRRVFNAAQIQSSNLITVSHTEGNARLIDWLLKLHPHSMGETEECLLSATVAAAEEKERQTKAILAGIVSGVEFETAIPLRNYQVQGVELVHTVNGLLCGDDLGLGKTAIGIGLACIAETRPVMVVCQTHLQKQWKEAFGKFAPLLNVTIAKTGKPVTVDADVLIITYSKLKGWVDGNFRPRTFIADEVQEFRHADSDKYKAGAVFAAEANWRLGLSATPVYNYGGEVWNIMQILQPGALGESGEFVKEWCTYGATDKKWIVADPAALGSFLRSQSLMIRRTRKDVGRELPAVQSFAELVPYDEDVMKGMEEECLQLSRKLLSSADFTEKGQAARLLDLKLRQATGIAKAPFVAELVAEMVESGKKVILTGWHREVYAIWQAKFENRRVKNWLYTGSESPTAKDRAAREFIAHEGGAVFILSNRSGAGLDGLQKVCDTIVFGELDWSPQVHAQIIGRAQRDGQLNENGVSVFYLVSDAGSDPIIAGLLGVKMEQGAGITDPDVPIADTKLATSLSTVSDAQAEKSRVVELARRYMARYGAKAQKAA